MASLNLNLALETARRAADVASEVCLRWFRNGVDVSWKSDRSPVTQADKEAEAAMIACIRSAFPDHGILGEETGETAGADGTRWILDPLDGTRGFTRGGSFWGPLVALEHGGEIVSGALALPVLGRTYWAAKGLGAWRNDERIRLAPPPEDWSNATVSLGELQRLLSSPKGEHIKRIIMASASARSFGDVAAVAMLLDGRAEAWIEGGVRIWDLAPSKILVEEAGGLLTDFEGRPVVTSGEALASTPALHAKLLRMLQE
jgi:histidinol-phosphatase